MKELMQIIAFISMGLLCITLYFTYQRFRLRKSTRGMKRSEITLRSYLKAKKRKNEINEHVEEIITLDNNYKILHKKLKIEFWVFFSLTILCWIIMITLGIAYGFFTNLNENGESTKELIINICSKIS